MTPLPRGASCPLPVRQGSPRPLGALQAPGWPSGLAASARGPVSREDEWHSCRGPEACGGAGLATARCPEAAWHHTAPIHLGTEAQIQGEGPPGGLSEEDVPLRAWRGGEMGRALVLKSQLCPSRRTLPPPRPWAQPLAPVPQYLSASESDTSASPSQSRRWLGPGLGGQQDLGGPKPGPDAPGRLAGGPCSPRDSECVRGGGGRGTPGSGYSHRARNEERALRMPQPWCPDCTHCLATVQPQPRPPRAARHTLQGSVPQAARHPHGPQSDTRAPISLCGPRACRPVLPLNLPRMQLPRACLPAAPKTARISKDPGGSPGLPWAGYGDAGAG